MDEYDKRIFSANLERFMEIRAIKQTDIANLLRVSKSTVSSWCNAQKMPRMDKIEILANFFGVLKSDLIEEKPTPASEDGLDASEASLIELFRLVPSANRSMVLQMIEAALKSQGLL